MKNVKVYQDVIDVSIDSGDSKSVQQYGLMSGLNDLENVAEENRYHIRGKP